MLREIEFGFEVIPEIQSPHVTLSESRVGQPHVGTIELDESALPAGGGSWDWLVLSPLVVGAIAVELEWLYAIWTYAAWPVLRVIAGYLR